ncbi:MAG: hypothetical protein ACOX1S_09280 [Anaerostipes sp.]|jgi:hypothetical protein
MRSKIGVVCMIVTVCFCTVVGCSKNSNNEDEAILNQVTDKIYLSKTNVVKDSSGIEKVSYKAENVSNDTFTLEGILVYACDKDLNYIEPMNKNKSEKLASKKQSHEFEYSFDKKVEFVKITGYQYTQNGKRYIDTFDNVLVVRRNKSTYIGNDNYTDQEILDKADEKNTKLPSGISRDEIKGILMSVASISKNTGTTLEQACTAIGMSFDDYQKLITAESSEKLPSEEISGTFVCIERLMKNKGMTLEKACKTVGITLEEYKKISKKYYE